MNDCNMFIFLFYWPTISQKKKTTAAMVAALRRKKPKKQIEKTNVKVFFQHLAGNGFDH